MGNPAKKAGNVSQLRQRAKIAASAYLTDLFTRLPSETNQTIRQLTPRAWAQAQAPLRATRASTEE